MGCSFIQHERRLNTLLGRGSQRRFEWTLPSMTECAVPHKVPFSSRADGAVMITRRLSGNPHTLGVTADGQVPREPVWSAIQDVHAPSPLQDCPDPTMVLPSSSLLPRTEQQCSRPPDQPPASPSGWERRAGLSSGLGGAGWATGRRALRISSVG